MSYPHHPGRTPRPMAQPQLPAFCRTRPLRPGPLLCDANSLKSLLYLVLLLQLSIVHEDVLRACLAVGPLQVHGTVLRACPPAWYACSASQHCFAIFVYENNNNNIHNNNKS